MFRTNKTSTNLLNRKGDFSPITHLQINIEVQAYSDARYKTNTLVQSIEECLFASQADGSDSKLFPNCLHARSYQPAPYGPLTIKGRNVTWPLKWWWFVGEWHLINTVYYFSGCVLFGRGGSKQTYREAGQKINTFPHHPADRVGAKECLAEWPDEVTSSCFPWSVSPWHKLARLKMGQSSSYRNQHGYTGAGLIPKRGAPVKHLGEVS